MPFGIGQERLPLLLNLINLNILAHEHPLRHPPARIKLTHEHFLVKRVRLQLHELPVGGHPTVHEDLLDRVEFRDADVVVQAEGDRLEDRGEHVLFGDVEVQPGEGALDPRAPIRGEDRTE